MPFDGDAAVLLLTMKCNIACAHCSVNSHPGRTEHMPLPRALELVDELCAAPWLQYIDVTGGEPLLRLPELLEIARRARSHGKSVRVVSNGFWARNTDRAAAIVRQLVDAGVTSIGLSIDEWHLDYLDAAVVANYIAAARQMGMIPLLSCVIRGPVTPHDDARLVEEILVLLARYGVDRGECLEHDRWTAMRARVADVSRAAFDREIAASYVLVGWQLLTGEGRASALTDVRHQRLDATVPVACTAAGNLPTFDEEGRLFPCCAPWCSRKAHAYDRHPGEPAAAAIERMQADPVVELIHRQGPLVLIRALQERGMSFPVHHSGICNQCGMLFDRAPLALLREIASEIQETITGRVR
jgi:pyruvate-formate lyase-activating enzyme